MKVCAISDTHGYLPEIPECDLLLIAGDVSPIDRDDPREQRDWCSAHFSAWLRDHARCRAEEIAWIAGNHDTWIWRWGIGRKLARIERTHYLQDRAVEICGLKIYGTPWTTGLGLPNSWWAFDRLVIPGRRNPFASIPDDADIVLSHEPPRGVGDMTLRGKRAGSLELSERLCEIEPRLVVNGHIHEDAGIRRPWPGSETAVVNAALLDHSYRPVREPFIVEV